MSIEKTQSQKLSHKSLSDKDLLERLKAEVGDWNRLASFFGVSYQALMGWKNARGFPRSHTREKALRLLAGEEHLEAEGEETEAERQAVLAGLAEFCKVRIETMVRLRRRRSLSGVADLLAALAFERPEEKEKKEP